MRNDISLQNMISEISNRAIGRYNLKTDDDDIRQWVGFRHEKLTEGSVLRLKRLDNPNNLWKTIVICLVREPAHFHDAFSWVADIRDDLPDPETADLYFIGAVTDTDVSQEFCTNLESKEQFCRKYIMRPSEDIPGLMDRTFLSSTTETEVSEEIVDPLFTAIQVTGEKLAQFTTEHQLRWRNMLISGHTGAELIDRLFIDVTALDQSQANETSGENIVE
jgi:hypothetical protein